MHEVGHPASGFTPQLNAGTKVGGPEGVEVEAPLLLLPVEALPLEPVEAPLVPLDWTLPLLPVPELLALVLAVVVPLLLPLPLLEGALPELPLLLLLVPASGRA